MSQKKLKILAADDTPQILRMIEMRLSLSGHTVIKAMNGREAVEKASQYKPDFILLDIMMPDMNGLEALMQIKKFAPNIPIAMVTASTANKHLKEALNHGAIGYITKPINFKDIDRLISEVTHKFKLENMQTQIEDISRMAAIGEVSGRIAHDILNPVSSILSKIELLIRESSDMDNSIDGIEKIIQVWKQQFVSGGLEDYLNQTLPSYTQSQTNAQKDFTSLDSGLLTLRKKQGKLSEEIKNIERQLVRVIMLLDNLRGLSEERATVEEVDINKLLRDTKEIVYDMLWKRDIQIVENYSQNIPKIMANSSELMQVFTNITRNAADSIEKLPPDTPSRKKKISYDTSLSHNRIEIRISDRGVGIPEMDWERIFDPNYTTKNRKGAGLGLSISRRFIRNLGGDIEVENSIPGQGTFILIWIPAKSKTGKKIFVQQ
jgi:signal transduction histidine kinase